MDEDLSWSTHIKNVCAKATMTMLQIRKQVGKTWGLNAKICKWAYTALVRPILSYGCLVWLPGLRKDSNVRQLTKVQRKACVSILRAMHTTPTLGMELMVDLRPIEIHLKGIAMGSYRRLLQNGHWRLRPGELLKESNHCNMVEKLTRGLTNLRQKTDKLQNTDRQQTLFDTRIGDRKTLNETKFRPKPQDLGIINCFTDGSKGDNENTGSAFLNMHMNWKTDGFFRLKDYNTVYQAEVHAIKQAADNLLQKNIQDHKINFYIDNQAAIKSLGKLENKNVQVKETKSSLNKLGENNQVTLNWIPAHEDHKGNEIADRLAKRGSRVGVRGDDPPPSPPPGMCG